MVPNAALCSNSTSKEVRSCSLELPPDQSWKLQEHRPHCLAALHWIVPTGKRDSLCIQCGLLLFQLRHALSHPAALHCCRKHSSIFSVTCPEAEGGSQVLSLVQQEAVLSVRLPLPGSLYLLNLFFRLCYSIKSQKDSPINFRDLQFKIDYCWSGSIRREILCSLLIWTCNSSIGQAISVSK